MSRSYFIHDARGDRRADESELPLSIGAGPRADISVAATSAADDVAADLIVATIALSEGHAFFQPGDKTATPMFHNRERISDSVWLKSGDTIELGDALITWTVDGDQVTIECGPRDRNASASQPPTAAPPPSIRSAPTEGPISAPPTVTPTSARAKKAALAGFSLLLVAALFVLLATPVSVEISPSPAAQSFDGFPPPVPVWNRYMVLPGTYRVAATLDGYQPLAESVSIGFRDSRDLRFEMHELPGLIQINVAPIVDYRLLVGDAQTPRSSDGFWQIPRGLQTLRLQTDRYLPVQLSLDVNGFGKRQSIDVGLQPAWADVHISTMPPGAAVSVRDTYVGTTPLDVEILHGPATIVFSLAKHKSVTLSSEITAGAVLELNDIVLPPADGRLSIRSEPEGAVISIDGTFIGTTPAVVEVPSGRETTVKLTKPGYTDVTRRTQLEPEQTSELSIALLASYGIVFVSSRPADAELLIDGKPAGSATQRLELTTRPHTLEIRKAGYAPKKTTVTPKVGISSSVDISLQTTAQAKAAATPMVIKTGDGQTMHLVTPKGTFEMGASRRDAGRRSNESPRTAELTRAFYVAEKEVSNAEFSLFAPAHKSGSTENADLDGPNQPVVNVSWNDAAGYCNALSKRDGLRPAYNEGANPQLIVPVPNGYRMPTEAEWAYLARVHGRNAPGRYPWIGSYPPPPGSGNFADARIADTFADVVPDYDDGYRATAPVGSFPAQPGGLYDLAGNVSEWTSDYYAVYPGQAEAIVRDPTGPTTGEHRTIRGSSWRHGSIVELRSSFRDYSREARNDLGFRIVRYAE